jgi:hypothetical protein
MQSKTSQRLGIYGGGGGWGALANIILDPPYLMEKHKKHVQKMVNFSQNFCCSKIFCFLL